MLLLCIGIWALTRTGFFHPSLLVPLHLVRVSLNSLHGSTCSEPQTRMLKRPSGRPGRMGLARKHGHKPRKCSLLCTDRPLHVKEKHSKRERRNKSNKFITTWPKRSERDKRPPVVRRSAVEWPPSKQSWGDYRSIRHGSGETWR